MKKFDAIILSGGKGTRVNKYTSKLPKCLIQINRKPFLYHQLKYLRKYDVNNVIISIGYLGKKIDTYLRKNINFINFKTIDDGKSPLGTGGAVTKSLRYLKKNFFIIYGDSYLNFDLKNIINNKKLATMAIYRNKNRYDKSNIDIKKTKKIRYFKKNTTKKLEYIDYGVSYVDHKIFNGIKENTKFELSDFFENLSKKNKLSCYEVKKRFYEIGSYNGIKDIKKFLSK